MGAVQGHTTSFALKALHLHCWILMYASAEHPMNLDTNRTHSEIVVGGLGIQGVDTLFNQWNDTFSVYLTDVVGPKFGVSFKLVYLDFYSTYQAVQAREVDMVYTNPSIYACLEREYQASPIVSLRNRRKVGEKYHELDHFYGAIFVRANSSITKIAEIENKVVEAVSLVGLGACQLQWDELAHRDIPFLSAPRQVRFSSSQKKIVRDVISGEADVGMVRTDLAEAMVSAGEIEPGSIRVLENLQGRSDDPDFPFPHSTRLAAPEWPLAALPWTNWELSREVAKALLAITPTDQAAISGKYATWVPPLSYFGMHQMHSKLNWIDGDNKCVRAGDLCQTVVCPAGQLKKSCEQILRGCEEIGEPCPEGYDCLCNPCHPLPDKTCGGRENFVFREQDAQCVCRSGFEQLPGTDECVEIADSESTSVRIVLAVVLVVAALVFLVASWVYHLQGHKQDDSWKISLDELQFPEPRVVLGRGTYGQVLLADFRSTLVAVKRVLPKAPKAVHVTKPPKKPLPLLSFSNSLFEVIVTDIPASSATRPVTSAGGKDGVGDRVRCRAPQDANEQPIPRDVHNQTDIAIEIENKHDDPNSDFNNNGTKTCGSGDSLASENAQGCTLPFASGIATDSAHVCSEYEGEGKLDREQSTTSQRSHWSFLSKSRLGPISSPGDISGNVQLYRVKQSVSKNQPARASEMQLHLHNKNDMIKSTLSIKSSSSWSMKKGLSNVLKFPSHKDAPAQQVDGSRTTTDSSQHKDLVSRFLHEMQVIVFLRHPNIVTVMGAVVDNKSEPLMVMEYMKHGSLYDLMHNHTMQFDSEITMGVLEGIISGMMYLHSAKPPVLHNDLKSANVLVGANFAAKLADFGLSMKRKSSGFLGTPFWMAPELLTLGCQPTMKTDIYSFGVTFYELLTRKEPYEEYENVEEVVDMLRDAEMDPPLRPTLPEGLPKDAAAIMCACWNPDPELRPSFEQIKIMVSQLNLKDLDVWLGRHNHGSKGKRTANQLLYDVFPPHIADTLRQGKKVEPEHHEVVTIFFSDIVGFTDISRALQPIEVMDMLDRLYAKFDAIARKHDIFKVETIGDAYMAVANLVKQQSNHAERIGMFALEAVRTANELAIKEDRPELGCVNIRVGFHSGPVVSSVVGNMNPRFCLFGDTVNTSSRMESNSEKNKIHLSEDSADLLVQQAPTVQLNCRGLISIKGKGDMKTYWLEGFAVASH